jgi:hypothetical protein
VIIVWKSKPSDIVIVFADFFGRDDKKLAVASRRNAADQFFIFIGSAAENSQKLFLFLDFARLADIRNRIGARSPFRVSALSTRGLQFGNGGFELVNIAVFVFFRAVDFAAQTVDFRLQARTSFPNL